MTRPMDDRIIREPEEKRLTGLSRSTRWRLEKRGDYPKSVPLTRRSKGHWLSELLQWLESRGSHDVAA